LFRVLQEALTNVQRHTRSPWVNVSICQKKKEFVLTIADRGAGVPAQQLYSFQQRNTDAGIGLTIMRERLEEHGGQLRIDSNSRGTKLTAILRSRRTSKSSRIPSPVTT
jgi:two-component system NarL family sensor kinase